MKSPKTTIAGILSIVGGVISFAVLWLKTGALPDVSVLAASITAGVGLILAADVTPPAAK
jgi:hypothetical protein